MSEGERHWKGTSKLSGNLQTEQPTLADVLHLVDTEMPYWKYQNLRLASSETNANISTPEWEKIKKCEAAGLSIEDDRFEFSVDCAKLNPTGAPCSKFPQTCHSICANATSPSHENQIFHVRSDMDDNVLKCHILGLGRRHYPSKDHYIHDNLAFRRFCVYMKYIRFIRLTLLCDLDIETIELLIQECKHFGMLDHNGYIDLHGSAVIQSNLQHFIDNFVCDNKNMTLMIYNSFQNDYIKQVYGLQSLHTVRNLQITFKNLEYDILHSCHPRLYRIDIGILDPLTQTECKTHLLPFYKSRIWYINESNLRLKIFLELSQFEHFLESFVIPFNNLFLKSNKDSNYFLIEFMMIYKHQNDDLLNDLSNRFAYRLGDMIRSDWFVQIDFEQG